MRGLGNETSVRGLGNETSVRGLGMRLLSRTHCLYLLYCISYTLCSLSFSRNLMTQPCAYSMRCVETGLPLEGQLSSSSSN